MLLSEIAKKYQKKITVWHVLVVEDTDGDLSILFKNNDRVAQQFQKNWCPIVYPAMQYKVVGEMFYKDAMNLLDARTKEREIDYERITNEYLKESRSQS